MKTQNRDSKGRIQTNKVSDVPTKLYNGSIYRAVGSVTGRLKGVVNDVAVLSVHGKLFAVNRDRLRFVTSDDVLAYLADSAA